MSGRLKNRGPRVQTVEDVREADLGSFGGVDGEEAEPELSWRLDPEVSLSDWLIKVKDENGTKDYHVHRAMLATGPRKCQYFVRLFRGAASGMRETAQRTSSLELLPSAATAFPVFLDYAYTGDLKATTELACALLHLADYLGCRALHIAAQTFIREDLSDKVEGAPAYFGEAQLYQLEKVAELALNLSLTYFHQIADRDGSFDGIPPATILEMTKSDELGQKSGYRYGRALSVGKFAVQYCNGLHKDEVDGDFLAALTTEELMDRVVPEVAYPLLALAIQHQPQPGQGERPLAERCIEVCAENYEESLVPIIMEQTEKEEAELNEYEEETARRPPAKQAKRRRTSGSSAAAAPPVAPSRPALRNLLPGSLPDDVKIRILSLALLHASGNR